MLKFNMLKYNPTSLKELWCQSGLTQSELARKIGASRQKVHNWLTLGDQPDAATLMEIATKFNKPMSYFFADNYSDSSK
ncbi:MAG: helix-turn-helix transcriptional regulator [Smithella sp.]|jgi:transcriptional regulator with XRE-family HTH domain